MPYTAKIEFYDGRFDESIFKTEKRAYKYMDKVFLGKSVFRKKAVKSVTIIGENEEMTFTPMAPLSKLVERLIKEVDYLSGEVAELGEQLSDVTAAVCDEHGFLPQRKETAAETAARVEAEAEADDAAQARQDTDFHFPSGVDASGDGEAARVIAAAQAAAVHRAQERKRNRQG
jgi:hypothetical protein